MRLPGQYDERLFAAAGISGMQGPYYNWNRWYLPSVGRYLELDPIALAGGFNGSFGPDWYNYALGNPVSRVDPTGEQSAADLANCALHPIECAQGNECAEKAFQATLKQFGRQGHNDSGDAFRHCYWNCCMAQKMGARGAERIGNAHENWDGNPSCEKDMDLANNGTGRQLGAANPGGDCALLCGAAPLQPQPKPPCTPCKKDYGNY